MAQMIKNLPAMQETWVWSLGQEHRLEKGRTTHSSILAWRLPGQRSLAGYSPWGCRVRQDWGTNTLTFQGNFAADSQTAPYTLLEEQEMCLWEVSKWCYPLRWASSQQHRRCDIMKGPQDFTRRLLFLLELCKPSMRIGLLAGSGLSQEQCHCSEGLRAVVAGIRPDRGAQLPGQLLVAFPWGIGRLPSLDALHRGQGTRKVQLLACPPSSAVCSWERNACSLNFWVQILRLWHEGLGPESRPPDLMPWDSMVLLYALSRLSENSFYDQSMTQLCSPSLRPPPGPPPNLLAWISDCSGLRSDPSLSLLPSTAHSQQSDLTQIPPTTPFTVSHLLPVFVMPSNPEDLTQVCFSDPTTHH